MELELHELDLRYAELRVSSPRRHAHLVASLAQHGQRDPVLVVCADEVDAQTAFVLIDGFARVRALQALGRDVVLAVAVDLDVAHALVMAWRLEVGPRRSALEDGWLVAELIETHGWSQAQVADSLQRSRSWVCRRLSLVETLSDAVQDAIRMGRIPAHAAMKHLTPLARANASDCDTLVKSLGTDPISVRQMERLYLGYKRADDLGRQRLVAQPRLFLQAEDATHGEPDLLDGDPAKPLVDDLDAISGLARRARRRLQDGLLDELDPTRRQRVVQSSQEARLTLGRLLDHIDRHAPNPG